MLSVNDENYREYEVYYLMNFVLLGFGAQEEKFYVKSIIPVSKSSHYQAVDLIMIQFEYHKPSVSVVCILFFEFAKK